jgi:hypothetical protein
LAIAGVIIGFCGVALTMAITVLFILYFDRGGLAP